MGNVIFAVAQFYECHKNTSRSFLCKSSWVLPLPIAAGAVLNPVLARVSTNSQAGLFTL